jgi:hypothetical protein
MSSTHPTFSTRNDLWLFYITLNVKHIKYKIIISLHTKKKRTKKVEMVEKEQHQCKEEPYVLMLSLILCCHINKTKVKSKKQKAKSKKQKAKIKKQKAKSKKQKAKSKKQKAKSKKQISLKENKLISFLTVKSYSFPLIHNNSV